MLEHVLFCLNVRLCYIVSLCCFPQCFIKTSSVRHKFKKNPLKHIIMIEWNLNVPFKYTQSRLNIDGMVEFHPQNIL